MSSKYDAAREAFGSGDLSWTNDEIVAQLVSSAYLFEPSHRDARAIKGALGDPVELTGKSITDGWAKCAKVVFRQVSGGSPASAVVFRREAKNDAGRTLIFYSNEVANFPMMPNGGDIEVEIPARGIFRL